MSNSNSKVYSLAQLLLSWENSPGVCKVNVKPREENSEDEGDRDQAPKLPPPPCPTENHNIPLPSCPFQPSLRSGTRKGLERGDPFLCTKTVTKAKFFEGERSGSRKELETEDPFLCPKNVTKAKFFRGDNCKGSGKRAGKSLSMFSCKYSCEVRDDSLVMRMVHVSSSNLSKDKELRTSDPWLSN